MKRVRLTAPLLCAAVTLVPLQAFAGGGTDVTFENFKIQLIDRNLTDGIDAAITFPTEFQANGFPYPGGSVVNVQGNATNPDYQQGVVTYGDIAFAPISSALNLPVTSSSASFSGNPFDATGATINVQAQAFAAPGDDAFANTVLAFNWSGAPRLFTLSPNTDLVITSSVRIQAFADPNAFEQQEFGAAQLDLSLTSVAGAANPQSSSFSDFIFAGNSPGPEYIDQSFAVAVSFTNSTDASMNGWLQGYFLVSALSNEAPMSPIPEPSMAAGLIVGLGMLAISRRARYARSRKGMPGRGT